MKTKMTAKFHSLKISLLMSGVLLVLRLASAQCDPPPSGLVAWWPGEGNANDVFGTNNGVAQGGLNYAAGEVGQAFSFDGGASTAVFCPASASLNVGTGVGFTIECWIRPVDLNIEHPLVEWNNGSVWGSHFWVNVHNGGVLGPGALYCNILDTTGAGHGIWTATGIVNTNSLQYVVLTYNRANGNCAIYYDGTVAASGNIGVFTPQTSYNLYIGHRPQGNATFNGIMDEVSVYNRALSANEIAAIYAAGRAGKCRVPSISSQPQSQLGYWGQSASFSVGASPLPLDYQWQSNGVAISGATNQTLTLTNLQNSFAAGYTVVVANSYGSVTSAPPANLTINPAGVGIALYPGVKIDGVVGLTYGIQYSTNLANTNGWIGLTNLTFTQPTEIWYDAIPASLSSKFYRVLQGPIPIP